MKNHSPLTPEELESLLTWLDSDTARAATKYEVIRHGLVQRFTNRGCMDAETLADETIDRVTKRVAEIAVTYNGEPANYFHGIARYVFLEYCREQRLQQNRPPPDPEPTFSELFYNCLDECLSELPSEKRALILRYYRDVKSAKIESRKKMRQEMSLKPDALRVQIFRIRRTLETCISDCVERNETL